MILYPWGLSSTFLAPLPGSVAPGFYYSVHFIFAWVAYKIKTKKLDNERCFGAFSKGSQEYQ
jgi:4-hydroxybenzoate polyprenyltransferase